MKKTFVAILAVFCLFGLIGCQDEDANQVSAEDTPVTVTPEAPSTVIVSNIAGLSLTTGQKEYVSTDAKITYSIENSTDITYSFGPSTISFEVLRDGEWHGLAFRTDIGDIGAHDIAIAVLPHNTHAGTKSFYFHGDFVPAGTYRLVIGIAPFDDSSYSATEYIATEFSVVE